MEFPGQALSTGMQKEEEKKKRRRKRKRTKRPKPELDLPRELLVDIFARLPVKSLMRFMCLSDDWCNTISDPQFAKWHFERVSEKNKNHRLLVSINDGLMSLDYEDWSGDEDAVRWFDFPFTEERFSKILGTCNGLVCTAFDDFINLFIWNPTTSEYKELPDPGISLNLFLCRYGFGFDASSNDYKVVLAVSHLGNVFSETDLNVFSLRTNTWRKVHDSSYPYHNVMYSQPDLGSFCNGAIHWLSVWGNEEGDNHIIVTFDLATEKFRSLPLPAGNGERMYADTLGVLGGKLCLNCNLDGDIEIWVMQEYGVGESWSKLILVPTSNQDFVSSYMLTPICYSSTGDIIAVNEVYEVMKFNSEEKKLKYYPLCIGWHKREAVIYLESLESVTLE